MKRTVAVAALLAILAAPAVADVIGGAGMSMGTAGTREWSFIGMYDFAEMSAWRLGPFEIPSMNLGILASTNDFSHAYIGLSARKEHLVFGGGYDTERRKFEARLTLLGVSF